MSKITITFKELKELIRMGYLKPKKVSRRKNRYRYSKAQIAQAIKARDGEMYRTPSDHMRGFVFQNQDNMATDALRRLAIDNENKARDINNLNAFQNFQQQFQQQLPYFANKSDLDKLRSDYRIEMDDMISDVNDSNYFENTTQSRFQSGLPNLDDSHSSSGLQNIPSQYIGQQNYSFPEGSLNDINSTPIASPRESEYFDDTPFGPIHNSSVNSFDEPVNEDDFETLNAEEEGRNSPSNISAISSISRVTSAPVAEPQQAPEPVAEPEPEPVAGARRMGRVPNSERGEELRAFLSAQKRNKNWFIDNILNYFETNPRIKGIPAGRETLRKKNMGELFEILKQLYPTNYMDLE